MPLCAVTDIYVCADDMKKTLTNGAQIVGKCSEAPVLSAVIANFISLDIHICAPTVAGHSSGSQRSNNTGKFTRRTVKDMYVPSVNAPLNGLPR